MQLPVLGVCCSAVLTRTEVPSNYILSRVKRPSVYMGTLITAWGVIMTLAGVVHSYAGLLAVRFFLGVFGRSTWHTSPNIDSLTESCRGRLLPGSGVHRIPLVSSPRDADSHRYLLPGQCALGRLLRPPRGGHQSDGRYRRPARLAMDLSSRIPPPDFVFDAFADPQSRRFRRES